jgi:hypothetical protein
MLQHCFSMASATVRLEAAMKTSIVLCALLLGCDDRPPVTGAVDASGVADSAGLPTCPPGAMYLAPCQPSDPMCAIPGASSEASPLFCLCGCDRQHCHWETDQIGVGPCDAATPVEAGVDLAGATPVDVGVDLADPCPMTEPVTSCFFPSTCTVPAAVCHYGGTTCTCSPSGVPNQGYWQCNPDVCATINSFSGACTVSTSCCAPQGVCTCMQVCTSRVWQCYGEAGADLSMVPGVDMCP